MEKEFTDWYKSNEKRFNHGQFDAKQIAYSAWIEGKKVVKNNAVSPLISNNEVAVCDCEKCKPFINFAAGFRKNKTCIKDKAN